MEHVKVVTVADVAQLVEHRIVTPVVAGSIPVIRPIHKLFHPSIHVRLKRLLLTFTLLLTLISSLFFVFLKVWNPSLYEPQNIPPTQFKVSQGDSLIEVASKLKRQQLIISKEWFVIYALWHDWDKQIKQGRYAFAGKKSGIDILMQIVRGQVAQNRLAILEGWNFNNLHQALKTAKHLSTSSRSLIAADDFRQQVSNALDLPVDFLDGAFLADTYFYADDADVMQILATANNHLQNTVQQVSDQLRGFTYLNNAIQLLSLAAIIEKEVLVASEKRIVSSVFHNRLAKNMLLQSDPTVIYAAGDRYKGNITYALLRNKHPYNTYTTKGLTPNPIAYVAQSTIIAALDPAPTDYLFFVAKGDGTHVFNEDLAGHQRAVDKYILNK